MPMLFPLAFLIADALLAAWRGPAAARLARRLALASSALAVAICVGAVVLGALASHRDNIALAQTLRGCARRASRWSSSGSTSSTCRCMPGCGEPVPVLGDWHDPDIAQRDNWRRELAEATPFAPAARGLAARRREAGLGAALRQGAALGGRQETDDAPSSLRCPARRRVAASHRAELWRIAPRPCTSAESAPKPSEPDGAATRRLRRRARRGAVDQLHPARVQRRREPAGAADRAERRAAPALRALGDRRRRRRQPRRHRDRDRAVAARAAACATCALSRNFGKEAALTAGIDRAARRRRAADGRRPAASAAR